MIYTAVDNFYVTEERLENSPSRLDGVPRGVETQLRIYGCQLIQEGGILLKLPQAVMATGQVLLHRFYVNESLKKFNIKRVAWACCWLATKLEEFPKKIREVLMTFYRVDLRHEGKEVVPLDIYGKEYPIFKKELIDVERRLLRTFGFILHVDHPHKFVLDYSRLLICGTALKQEAWNLANDSLRTTLCVRFRAETVACGLIFLAARRLQEPLPEDPPWWELFKVEKKEMYVVAKEVQALFSMPKVEYISVHRLLQSPRGSDIPRDNAAMVSPSTVTETATGTPLLSDHAASDMDISHIDGEGARADPGSVGSMERSPIGPTNETEVERRGGEEERGAESRHDRHKGRRRDDLDEDDRRRRRHKRREAEDPDSDSKQEERYDKREWVGDYRRERRDREDRGREGPRDPRDRSKERYREKDTWRDRDRRRS